MIDPLTNEELAKLRQLCDQTWLPQYERFLATIDDLQRQLRQAQKEQKLYWEAYQRAVVVVRALRGCRNAAREERDEAIKRGAEAIHIFYWMHQGRERWRTRAEVAEALLEAAWLQSGHPHFQTWYKSLTPAQRGESNENTEAS